MEGELLVRVHDRRVEALAVNDLGEHGEKERTTAKVKVFSVGATLQQHLSGSRGNSKGDRRYTMLSSESPGGVRRLKREFGSASARRGA